MSIGRLLALATLCVGCSRDIRLGDNTDAASGPFVAGTYDLTYVDPPDVSCSGSLSGHEASFTDLTREKLNLIDGSVTLSPTPTELTITGTPIEECCGQPSIVLVPEPAATPPTLWDGNAAGSPIVGPESTTSASIGIAFDSATVNSVVGITGGLAHIFTTTDSSGVCTVTFGARLVMR